MTLLLLVSLISTQYKDIIIQVAMIMKCPWSYFHLLSVFLLIQLQVLDEDDETDETDVTDESDDEGNDDADLGGGDEEEHDGGEDVESQGEGSNDGSASEDE